VLTYRVNAAPVPDDHWYHDRRQGGRLIGEVCHFIDTCAAIVGQPAAMVKAAGSSPEEALLADQLVVTMRYPNGSLATISYATSGHRSTDKERLDALGGGRSATIEDFRSVTLDGTAERSKTQDKGHVEQIRAFKAALANPDPTVTASFLQSMRATLRAAADLQSSGTAI
jgi:predicted dehydrogenase